MVREVNTPVEEAGGGKEERPTWLPEKFETPEQLAQSYAELEKKQSAPTPETPPAEDPTKGTPLEKPGETPGAPPALNIKEAAKAAAETPPPDPAAEQKDLLTPYFHEWQQTGEVSEKSYKELEGKGIPPTLVNQFIAGQSALAQQQADLVFGIVGGEQSFQQMCAWAEKHLDQGQQEWFDQQMDSMDMRSTEMAVRALHSIWARSGDAPAPVKFEGTTTPAVTPGYESTAQVVEAMSDPRYKTDPAYRKKVEEKLRRSPGVLEPTNR